MVLPERMMGAQPVSTHTAHVPAVPGTSHVSRICPPYRPIVEIDADYSRLPIDAGFNWSEAFAEIACGEWYLVVFRSQHRRDADDAYLTWLDEQASRAASQHPGFLYYFIGTPRPDGSCLSFCLWHSRQDAVAAAADPEHQEAMRKGLPFFAHYQLERYRVIKRTGELLMLPLPQPTPSTVPIATVHAIPAFGVM
jgi:hypothetical protein